MAVVDLRLQVPTLLRWEVDRGGEAASSLSRSLAHFVLVLFSVDPLRLDCIYFALFAIAREHEKKRALRGFPPCCRRRRRLCHKMYALRAPTTSLRSSSTTLRAFLHSKGLHSNFTSSPSVRSFRPLTSSTARSLLPTPSSSRLQSTQANGATSAAASTSTSTGEDFRKRFDISVTGHDIPDAFETFEAANWEPSIAAELTKAGFPAPTPIQSQAWPIAMQGRDMVAVSSTGSGKTVAFLLPAMAKIKRCALTASSHFTI